MTHLRSSGVHTYRSCHLCGHDGSREDSSSDRDVTDKGTLLVDVFAVDGLPGGLEAETDLLEPSLGLGSRLLDALGVGEDVRLLLERSVRLDDQFTRHDCWLVWDEGMGRADVLLSEVAGRRVPVPLTRAAG